MSRCKLVLFALIIVAALAPLSVLAADGEEQDEVAVRINGNQLVETNEQIGVVTVINGDATIAGTVTDVLVVVSGDILVQDAGQVDGVIWLVDGELCVEQNATVTADIYLSDDSAIQEACSGTITGEIFTESFEFDLSNQFAIFVTLFYLSSWLGFSIVLILVAFIFAGVGGKQLWESTGRMTSKLWQTLLAGFLLWIIAPFVVGILLFTIFGTPVALLVAVSASMLWMLGYITAGARLGATLTGQSTKTPVHHPYLPAITGVLILQLIMLVATAGLLLFVIGIIFASDAQGFFILIGIPTLVLWVALWFLGMWGAGALVYSAIKAWQSGGDKSQPQQDDEELLPEENADEELEDTDTTVDEDEDSTTENEEV